ncbi:hypothetical protein Pint_28828 [Pistacia integerrima]|uniref:Uncharacterized protein n=1 Tax=Pistacia integerrima TaxID=434235 RepID=A0ACC0X166_9ROSI|nr:hypothetical protein Pint_28828 [Pistacia integerrima]
MAQSTKLDVLSIVDENALMEQVQATHASNVEPPVCESAVKPLLYAIEVIFQPATTRSVSGFGPETQPQVEQDVWDDKAFHFDFPDELDVLSSTIIEICRKISCKFSGDADEDTTTFGILNTLSSYRWDEKAVLALAAFAFNYGEFLVAAQPYSSNPLIKSVSLLKQLPETQESSGTFKPKFEEHNDLIKATINVTKCVVELIQFTSQNISHFKPERINSATSGIPIAVYWTIRSIVACTSQIMGLTGMSYVETSSVAEAMKPSSLANKVRNIYNKIKTQLSQLTEEKRYDEVCQTFERLSNEDHIDNMEVLRALIYAKSDQLPLFDGDTKTRVSIEVLKGKNVLLLISDMKGFEEELLGLKKMYVESRQDPKMVESHYEVVWIPVVDRSTPWTLAKQDQFKNQQLRMQWYSVYQHSIVDPGIIMYIKKVWKFEKKPILVVLDPQGKVVNSNALHMLWIWGSSAFPLTKTREVELWKQETAKIESLAGSTYAHIPRWIAEENYIFLYGGENIYWIGEFTATANRISKDACIPLQMLYVGKSNPKDRIRENISIITVQMHSHSLEDLHLVWFFWERLESIWHSKMQLGCATEKDPLIVGINAIVDFDKNDEGWAIFCKGSDMVTANGELFLQILKDFDLWKTYMEDADFFAVFYHYYCRLLLGSLMQRVHSDNMKVLRAWIYAKEDQLPLLKGDTKTRASIEVLKSMTVLLLISEVEMSDEELFMLKEMYIESHQDPKRLDSQYEVLWIPVVDRSTPWTQEKLDQFENQQAKMPWYSPYQHSMIELAVIMYIEQEWQFKKEPILVVLDPQGKVVNNNALHMVWIWGSLAFPFTSAKEAELWSQETWPIYFLAGSINAAIPIWVYAYLQKISSVNLKSRLNVWINSWMEKEDCICLYVAENIDFIRKFTAMATKVEEAAGIQLHILDVGKRNIKEQISKNVFQVWFFWKRLESMWHSKMHLQCTIENDPIMQAITTILQAGESDEEWTFFFQGSTTAFVESEIILQCLRDFDLWRRYMNGKDFVITLYSYLCKLSLIQVMESPHMDNMEVLKALIYAKEDRLPLLNGASKTMKQFGIEVLKSKTVLLLISEVEITDKDLFMLKRLYVASLQDPARVENQYEVVWIPVVDKSTPWTQAKQHQFKNHQSSMPWYSVYHPSIIHPAVIMYIQEVWQFKKKPVLVIVDPKGKIVNYNALHMVWIWGIHAFPFTSTREAELWSEDTWQIYLLTPLDLDIPFWIEERKFICLYGGDNIEWIRKFTGTAAAVAKAAKIQLEILYVGQSNLKLEIGNNISIINKQKLSHTLQDLHLVWFFWVLLQNMLDSKKKLGCTVENDPIMLKIDTMLSCDRSNKEWVVFWKESAMAMAESERILLCLNDFDVWGTHMDNNGFVTTINHYLQKLLLVQLMESPHVDNMEALRALINANENQLPLLECATKRKASIEVLKSKTVLLFISNMEMSDEEIFMVNKLYIESRQDPTKVESFYEVVWIPIVDRSTPWSQAKQVQFENNQSRMPWYSVYDPSIIGPAVIMYIEQVWQFKEEPILVVLDPQGKVVNNNARHMLWIWRSLAFPFTSTREEELWSQETWRIDFFVESIIAAIPISMAEENYICLYGGENIDWIKNFTATAQRVAEAAGIQLQIIYMGKSGPKDQITKNISTITVEKLSHSLENLCQVRFFWERLRRMWASKKKLNSTVENDPIMQEINTLLCFDERDEGWAMFCRGSAMTMAKSEIILQSLRDFDLWGTRMIDNDFLNALNCYNHKLLLVQFMESLHLDNTKVLRALIYAKSDQLPLLKGDTKKRASIEALKRKNVLLLISDLDGFEEELFMLKQMYIESCQHPAMTESLYELVWIPIMDRSTPWTQAKQHQFENHQLSMPWYSVYHPSIINSAVIMYFQEVWQFKKKPILVVLDPLGKVVNKNALHMIYVWGALAFPFSSTSEACLWNGETWRIDFLAGSINAAIPIWIAIDNCICLYGGENIDWIRKFTATAHKVAEAACIRLKILYVGKNNSEKQVRKNIYTITMEKLSHSLQEYHQVWFFWKRLESMWHSKMQLSCMVENDPIMQEINTLLSFDKSEEGWAVFGRGSALAKAKGETILQCLRDFDIWRTHLEYKDFVTALNNHLNQLQQPTSIIKKKHFNHGVLTKIGQSGEQKQRIQLARAEDAHIALILFNVRIKTLIMLLQDCLMIIFKYETVILVIYQVEFLTEADKNLVEEYESLLMQLDVWL